MSDVIRAARDELMRLGLLASIDAKGVVPDLIVRSWRRSIGSSVGTAEACQRFQPVDTDSVLCRAAGPVLERWQHQLADSGTTLFLSDRSGSIVARRTTDSKAQRQLDLVHAAEGFDFSEESMGTNGLGTAMVERRPVWIEGSQHYNEGLEAVTCAAAPVASPTGSLVGAISVGGPSGATNRLMLPMTREIGLQIEERLRADARPQDLAMAMSHMRFTNSQRPTIIMDDESMLANTPGLPYVSVSSHVMLWELLNVQDWSGGRIVQLPLDSTGIEVSARRVLDGPRVHYVLHFSGPVSPASGAVLLDRSLTTLPAISAQGRSRRTAANVIVVEGPPGSGRAAASRRILADTRVAIDFVMTTADASRPVDWARLSAQVADGEDVLVRRVERLDQRGAAALRRLVSQHRAAVREENRANVLLLTVDYQGAPAWVQKLVDDIGISSRTKAIRETPELVPGLVRKILDQVDPQGRRTLSPAALQAFLEWGWPGNITELTATIAALVTHAPMPVIERRHLPKHLQQAPPRRRLTLLESAERDAIIRALHAADDNKSEAAKLLGLGRTTLYRRLKQLGLDGGEDLH
jgi:hypothetical protein